MEETYIFWGEEVVVNGVVILEILSNKPLGIGVQCGWVPTAFKWKVTASENNHLIGLNGMPSTEAFLEFAEATGQTFDLENPTPFFLDNILGIAGNNGYKLRIPLKVRKDGSIQCSSEIPVGATISFMKIEEGALSHAALQATRKALSQLGEHKPCLALFFDCITTRHKVGKNLIGELHQVQDALQGSKYVGCNTYSQVARLEGQFHGFHNCTSVVCVIPE